MTSETNRKIKERKKANDIFLTPIPLCKKQIEMIDYLPTDVWYDPFRNTGNYYNNFPSENKEWSEILDGRDFFEFDKPVDIICSNPPYSIIDRVIEKSLKLEPRVISYLIGLNNLTPRRIEIMNKAGYYITKFHMCKVWEWFGMSCIVQFEKDKKNIISYDRIIWR